MSEKRLPKYDPNVGFPKVLRGLLGEDEERGEYTRLAEAVGVTRAAISNYASGFSAASMDVCIAIAKYYGVSLDYLMGLSDVKTAKTEVRAISEYTGLSAGSVEVLKRFNSGNDPEEKKTIDFINTAFQAVLNLEKPRPDLFETEEEIEDYNYTFKQDYCHKSIFSVMENYIISVFQEDESIMIAGQEFSVNALYQRAVMRQIETHLRGLSAIEELKDKDGFFKRIEELKIKAGLKNRGE